jgi:cysteinyl-tRNA synthetase
MGLAVRDPRTGALRPIRSRSRGPLTIYVCGPTVYDDAHVGHARTYLIFDIARRQLLTDGQRVRQVMNITDFEDKIFDRATALQTSWKRLARSSERRFLADLDRLGILPSDRYPRASDHLVEMQRTVRRLERAGRLERRDGSLIYRPESRSNAPGRVAREAERHVVPEPSASTADGLALGEFSVWIPPHPGGPAWPSPWGPGTPGWHLECYVMARRYLGLPVDLHGGGRDLAFPHHYAEAELARSLDGGPFAQHYLYGEFVTQNGIKMAKSTGNLVRLRGVLDSAGAAAVRWYLLSVPYHRPLEWEPRGLAAARRSVTQVRNAFANALKDRGGGSVSLRSLERLRDGVARDLARNLGTERALARLLRYSEELDRAPRGAFPKGSHRAATTILSELEQRLGIPWRGRERRFSGPRRAGPAPR